MGLKVKQNRSGKSVSIKANQIAEQKVNQKGEFWLRSMASDLVDLSPVWSGAYITSHSYVPKGSGAGRSRQSTLLRADRQAKKSEAYGLLMQDISRYKDSFFKSRGGIFRNRSPHALAVERGDYPARRPYRVYETVAKKWNTK